MNALNPVSEASVKPPKEAWFQAAYAEHFDYVWHTARRLGARDGDIEDLAHDVFVTLHKTYERVDHTRPLRPWIAGIVYRTLSDYRKQARFRREVSEDKQVPRDPSPGPPELVEQRRKRALVNRALKELPEPQRVVFAMVEIDGYSVVEVAEILSEKENTLYSRLRLARKSFTSAAKRLLMTRGAGRE